MNHGNTAGNRATRRQFIRHVGAGAASLAVASCGSPSLANEGRIRVGIIGCGVRGAKALMPGLQTLPGVQITAVCDVYARNLAAARQAAGNADVLATADHRQVVDSPDVDAVVIAAPDRHHVPMTIQALAAGKDVYVEKPLTYSLDEAEQILDAIRSSDRVVQVGTQQRSMPQFQRARELVQQGVIGPVRMLRMWWNRNATPYRRATYDIRPEEVDWKAFLGGAPDRPFDPFTMSRWRFFWDLGGGSLTDLMIHWLDAASWICGLALPDRVATIGDHFATAGDYEIPDSVQCLMHYASQGVQATFCSTFVNSYEETGLELRGEKATIYLDRSRLELYPESKHGVEPLQMILDPSLRRGRGADGKVQDGKTGTILHLENWLDCIRTRREPVAHVADVLAATNTAHWANRALRTGRTIVPVS